MVLLLGGSFEHSMYQYLYYPLLNAKIIFTIVYNIAIFVIIYGFKRIVDSILNAWTRTTVKNYLLINPIKKLQQDP